MTKRTRPRLPATSAEPRKLVPQAHGGALLPGGTGAGGRHTDEWKLLCQGLSTKEAVLEQVKKVLENGDHPAWLGAWKFVVEQGFGRAKESIDMTSAGEKLEGTTLIWRFGDREVVFR